MATTLSLHRLAGALTSTALSRLRSLPRSFTESSVATSGRNRLDARDELGVAQLTERRSSRPPPALTPREALAQGRAAGMDGAALNERLITPTYVRLAPLFQRIVEPGFDAGNPTATRGPVTWFGIGAHPSAAAGAAIRLARDLQQPLRNGEDILPALGLGLRYLRVSDLASPGFDARTLELLQALVHDSPGDTPAEQLHTVFRTMETLFAEGNQAIFADIAEAGVAFLAFREAHPHATVEDVLENFHVEGSSPTGALSIYQRAPEHLDAAGPSFDVESWAAADTGPDSVVAAMAIYQRAGSEPDAAERRQLVLLANALLSLREQRDLVNPVMNHTKEGETDRYHLMALLTPTLKVDGGGQPWTFAHFAQHNLPSRGEHPFLPRACEYNWADLDTRMLGIWDFYSRIESPERSGELFNFPRSPTDFGEAWGQPSR